ncbi:MAG: ParB/RepB/Spo0J family partition protein [Phycisphaerae bacterium]|nr:ParB/RepB/Spo0J family partition protein [Phycisphaerae bacterium]
MPSRFQPRRYFDETALQKLAASIKSSGLVQPIVVRRQGEHQHELIAGERRWRAARMAGLTEIAAVVVELSDEQSAEWALIENVQREDLNPMERARAFGTLIEKFGLSHAQVAEKVGLDRVSVSNFIRLLELEPEIQQLLELGVSVGPDEQSRAGLTMGHGRCLLGVAPGVARVELARRAAREAWPVRHLERLITAMRAGESAGGEAGHQETFEERARRIARQDLEKRLSESLGTRVQVETDRSGKKGRLIIEFYSLDHFDGLLHRLGVGGGDTRS